MSIIFVKVFQSLRERRTIHEYWYIMTESFDSIENFEQSLSDRTDHLSFGGHSVPSDRLSYSTRATLQSPYQPWHLWLLLKKACFLCMWLGDPTNPLLCIDTSCSCLPPAKGPLCRTLSDRIDTRLSPPAHVYDWCIKRTNTYIQYHGFVWWNPVLCMMMGDCLLKQKRNVENPWTGYPENIYTRHGFSLWYGTIKML